jgi:hypothetical protein
MFVGAVFEFGKTDAIGHLPIIAILLTIALDNKPTREWRPALAAMAGCTGLIPASSCADNSSEGGRSDVILSQSLLGQLTPRSFAPRLEQAAGATRTGV